MRAILLLLLLLPSFVSAKTYFTLSGKPVEVEEPKYSWVEKTFVLPSGKLWKELIRVAKAEELNLTLKEQITAYVIYWADIYGLNHKQVDKLITCESNYDTDILGDKNKALGLFQWWEKSWDFYNKKYKTDLDRENWQHQIQMSAHVLAEKDGWKNWTNCWNFLKYGTWDKEKWK